LIIGSLVLASSAFADMPSTISSTGITTGGVSHVSPSTLTSVPSKSHLSAFEGVTTNAVSPEESNQVSGDGWNLIYKLVKLNVKIWGRVGWEYGRYESLKKYGVDIGSYPGAKNVTESWFKAHFR
jgi:hypothetical protein